MRKKINLWTRVLIVALLGTVAGCVEPIDIETGTYENALVIEGTISNELSLQEILLSRTYPLEEQGPLKERNAEVKVLSGTNVYSFIEVAPGLYRSVEAFRAETGEEYTLDITTSNGSKYSSKPEELPQSSEITSLYAEKTILEGETGIGIFVDVSGPEAISGYFKYDFSETYKIVSPFSYNFDVEVIDGEFVEVPKTREETVCYTTEASKEVLLANTNLQSGNELEAYLIKFMGRKNYRTAHRYSILVRQYSISEETFSYYETLKDFSESENLFSQNQLGLINGNVFSVNDPDEPVVGMFSVAGVSSRRIFLDFEDFYRREEFIPDSHVKCEVLTPPTATVAQRNILGEQLRIGDIKYLGYEVADPANVYRFVKAGCVDCTLYGSNTAPEFWKE
ncbi:DUF4249 domain-containing protein [Salinimicrobium sp. HB62]|uniref:DUF4249 domain-containing protein n=1 Tax=Salinimicrobium sp. HB62 TaxID=3077781 RepID=UPI002D7A0A70|nr:DUF4249 domain-containing protein [Salinimicrobium sp. HB62]